MRSLREVLVLSLTLLLTGCQIHPSVVASLDEEAQAKSFSPDPKWATLYIWNGSSFGSLANVKVNGDPLVSPLFYYKTFVQLKLTPGKYLIESNTYNVPPFVLPVPVEAGKQYFVFLEKGSLTRAEDDVGRTSVTASKMLPSRTASEELRPLQVYSAAIVRPLSIAVYYSPEFYKASMQTIRDLGFFKSEKYEIPLGLASSWMFDLALQDAFKSISVLTEWPPSAPVGEVDLILVPRITSFKSRSDWQKEAPSISYLVSLFLPGKGEIATIALDGFSLNNSWSSAIGSAAAQLVTAIDKLPLVATRGNVEPSPQSMGAEKSDGLQHLGLRNTGGFAVVPLLEKPESLQPATKMQECLESKVVSSHPTLRLVPGSRVRAIVFPWLEAGMAPSKEALANLLGRTSIASHLDRLRVRFILFPTIDYVDNLGGPFMCGAGAGGGGCLGVMLGSQATRFTVPVWDAANRTMVDAPIKGETEGFSWIVGFILPVWHMADTLEEACSEIVEAFGRRIER
jgi:hypothetical protein